MYDDDERTEPTDEEARVDAWRLQQLLELGFSVYDAELLVSRGVELGEARRLVRHGCPATLATQILT